MQGPYYVVKPIRITALLNIYCSHEHRIVCCVDFIHLKLAMLLDVSEE